MLPIGRPRTGRPAPVLGRALQGARRAQRHRPRRPGRGLRVGRRPGRPPDRPPRRRLARPRGNRRRRPRLDATAIVRVQKPGTNGPRSRTVRERYANGTERFASTDRQTDRQNFPARARALSRWGGSARSHLPGMGGTEVKHVTSQASKAELERLRAARSRFAEGRYACLACLDTGLLYVARTPYARPALGVVPCTECAKGGDRHLDGNVCIWAKGIHPCPLCGAHEGETIPPGWEPKPPVGFVAYDELPGYFDRLAKVSR